MSIGDLSASTSRQPAPNELDGHLQALSRALRQRLSEGLGRKGDAPVEPAEMRALLRVELRSLCAMARDSGIPPERLIIRLKAMWNSVPDMRARAPSDAQLDQMISACIEEYYS